MAELVGDGSFAVPPTPINSQRVVVDIDPSSRDRTPNVDWATINAVSLVAGPAALLESGFPVIATFSTAVDVSPDGSELRVSRLVPVQAGTGGRFRFNLDMPFGHVELVSGEWTVDLLLPAPTAGYDVELVDYTTEYNAEVFRGGRRTSISWWGTESPLDIVYRYLGG